MVEIEKATPGKSYHAGIDLADGWHITIANPGRPADQPTETTVVAIYDTTVDRWATDGEVWQDRVFRDRDELFELLRDALEAADEYADLEDHHSMAVADVGRVLSSIEPEARA